MATRQCLLAASAALVFALVHSVPAAAQAIIGSTLDQPAQERLEAAAQAACQPIDDKRGTVEFRTQVAGVLARRTSSSSRAQDRATEGTVSCGAWLLGMR